MTDTINFEEFPDVQCAVCQDGFDRKDLTRGPVTIPCGHTFHTVCLAFLFVPVGVTDYNEDYANGRCPLCRAHLFHISYKFYTEEMVKEREENLRRDLTLYHKRLSLMPTIRELSP